MNGTAGDSLFPYDDGYKLVPADDIYGEFTVPVNISQSTVPGGDLGVYEQREPLAVSVKAPITLVMIVVIAFTMFGNLLTIISVATQKQMQTVGNMYIASLACADLVVCSLVMTVFLGMSVVYDSWLLGSVFCDVWTFVENVSCTASLTNVTLIAWDRWHTVAWPLKALRVRTKRRAVGWIIAAWMLPIVFWTAMSTAVRVRNGMSPRGTCFLVWRPGPLVISAVVLSVYLPISATLVFFSLMMYVLRGHTAKMSNDLKRSTSGRDIKDSSAGGSGGTGGGGGGGDGRDEKTPGATGVGGRPMSFNPRFSIDAPSGNNETLDPAARSFLASASFSLSALSLNDLAQLEAFRDCQSFDNTKECAYYFSLESIPQDKGGYSSPIVVTAKRSVGTSTSPERYGLIRSVGVNTSPTQARYCNIPDVANVGLTATRDTYHRGVKRVSHRRNIYKQRFVDSGDSSTTTKGAGSSVDSAKSNSVDSEDSKTNNSVDDNSGKRKLGTIGRQLSVNDNDNEVKVNPLEPKIKLMSLGRSSSSESSRARDLENFLRVGSLVRLRHFGRSLSEESSASDDKGKFLKVKYSVVKLNGGSRSLSDDSNDSRQDNNHLTVKQHLWRNQSYRERRHLQVSSQESTESTHYLQVKAAKLDEVGRSASNDSSDSRFLQVTEPRVRFARLGRSISMDYDSISVLSSASNAKSKDYNHVPSTEAVAAAHKTSTGSGALTSAKMKRDRYASLMRKERHTTLKQCRLKQQLRAAKTLGLITAFLLVFWLPLAIMWPVKSFWPHAFSMRIYDVAVWATCLNSSVNPIIYCMCNAQFRKAFKKIVSRLRRC